MPIFDIVCEVCGFQGELFTQTGVMSCPNGCGGTLSKLPNYPAMVKLGHGYPSKRKERRGTAPYCGGAKSLFDQSHSRPSDEKSPGQTFREKTQKEGTMEWT